MSAQSSASKLPAVNPEMESLASEAFQQQSNFTGNLIVVRTPAVEWEKVWWDAFDAHVPKTNYLPNGEPYGLFGDHLGLVEPIPITVGGVEFSLGGFIIVVGTVNDKEIHFVLSGQQRSAEFVAFSRRPGQLLQSSLPDCKSNDLSFYWLEYLFRYQNKGDRIQSTSSDGLVLKKVWEVTYAALKKLRDTPLPLTQKPLSGSRATAYQQYLDAIKRSLDTDHKLSEGESPRIVFDWLKEKDECPGLSRDTWVNYVNKARRAHGD